MSQNLTISQNSNASDEALGSVTKPSLIQRGECKQTAFTSNCEEDEKISESSAPLPTTVSALKSENRYPVKSKIDYTEIAPSTNSPFGKQTVNTFDPIENKLTISKRSDSISSLDSEASSIYLSSDKSTKRKPSNWKPKIKCKFGEATIQYIKDRLEGVLFSGWLEEKQRLESIVRISTSSVKEQMVSKTDEVAHWKDVIEVDNCDHEMKKQLDAVMSSVPGSRDGKKWINVQAPSLTRGYMLWVLLPHSYPPDHYWFKVTTVTRHPLYGLQIGLTILRPLGEVDAESATARSRRLASSKAASEGDIPESLSLAWQNVYEGITSTCTWDAFTDWLAFILMPKNIAYALRMTVLTVISLLFGTVAIFKEGFRLFVYFMREGGTLIDKATPMAKIVLGFFEKIFGGFYLLLAMIYRDSRMGGSQPLPPGAGYQPPPPALMAGSPPHNAPSAATRRYVPAATWDHGSS